MTSLLARALRLPAPPEAPPGAEGTARVFHPSPRYLHLRLVRWSVTQIGSAIGLLLALGWRWVPGLEAIYGSIHFGTWSLIDLVGTRLWLLLEVWGVALFVLQLPLTLAAQKLDYAMRWYVVTDRSLRIREGLRTVRERTMTFANVQNLAIRQGPLQRALGIADLHVSSAGGGASGSEDGTSQDGQPDKGLHTAVFRGIDNAPQLRDEILAHLRQLRDSGIGDPDDCAADDGRRLVVTAELEEALDRLQAESVRLKHVVGHM